MTLANSTGKDLVMGLGEQPGSNPMARLLLARTALYAEQAAHPADERQRYAEFALRWIEKVDAATRTTVAAILCHTDPPPEVLQSLAAATPILRPVTAPTPAGPGSPQSPATGSGSSAVRPAGASDATALPSQPEIAEAFFAATETERLRLLSLIKADLDGDDRPGGTAAEPGDAEQRFAALDIAAMEGRIGEFVREFGRLLGIPKALCERILNDPSGEPLAVAAKAANMPAAVLQRILLLVNPAVSHSVRRVYALTDLFHRLDRGVTVTLLGLWRLNAQPDPAGVTGRRPPREASSAGLRSRFGALTERLGGVTSRPIPGNGGRRDLRSR